MTSDSAARKRELRLMIARRRRAIDRIVVSAMGEARELASWRTLVRRYPAASLLAALAAGFAVSVGFSRRGMSKWVAGGLVQMAVSTAQAQLKRELGSIWRDAAPRSADAGD